MTIQSKGLRENKQKFSTLKYLIRFNTPDVGNKPMYAISPGTCFFFPASKSSRVIFGCGARAENYSFWLISVLVLPSPQGHTSKPPEVGN